MPRWIGCLAGPGPNPIARMRSAMASAAQVPWEVAVASFPAVGKVVVPAEAAASVAQAPRTAAVRSLPEAAEASAGVGEAEAASAAAWFAAEPAAPSRWTPHRTWPARSRLPATDESNVDYS